jgi:hypothetical protein
VIVVDRVVVVLKAGSVEKVKVMRGWRKYWYLHIPTQLLYISLCVSKRAYGQAVIREGF